jgi:hypothetical protein
LLVQPWREWSPDLISNDSERPAKSSENSAIARWFH